MLKSFVVALAVVLVFSLAPGQTADNGLEPAQKIYGLSLFWKEVSYNFAYFDQVPRLDWDKAYREYIPKVLETKSTFEYYRVLQRFCALLKDGHTNVSMPREVWNKSLDRPQVVISDVQRTPIVTNVARGLSDVIPIGSEIVEVDGKSANVYLREVILSYISSSTEHILWYEGIVRLLEGTPGSAVAVTVKTPSGERRSATLVRNGKTSKEPWLKEQPQYHLSEFKWIDGDVAYVALNSFNDSRSFRNSKPRSRNCIKRKGSSLTSEKIPEDRLGMALLFWITSRIFRLVDLPGEQENTVVHSRHGGDSRHEMVIRQASITSISLATFGTEAIMTHCTLVRGRRSRFRQSC